MHVLAMGHLAATHRTTAAFTSSLVTVIAVTCNGREESYRMYRPFKTACHIKKILYKSLQRTSQTTEQFCHVLKKKKTVCTIDFIAANTTSLSKQWVAVVSCGTSEIEIDNVLR